MTEALRTPDERFEGLPGWGYAPHWLQPFAAGHWSADAASAHGEGALLRMHYIDEGPRDAPATVLCLHGNPSWSYIWRHMVPVFTQAGLRVVAPDLIGFGRSDKPVDDSWHTFERHRHSLLAFIDALNLRDVMLACQDWGGIFGLTLPMARPERFTRLLVMNTTLATGGLTDGFRQWRAYSNSQPDLAVGKLLRRGKPDMTAEEAASYDAPFPDVRYKAALRAFPNLVPEGADAPGAAIGREAEDFWRHRWQGDSFMAIGLADPVLGEPTMMGLHSAIRGCPPPLRLPQAGHFVQEWGAPIAQAALAHWGLTPAGQALV